MAKLIEARPENKEPEVKSDLPDVLADLGARLRSMPSLDSFQKPLPELRMQLKKFID